MAALQEKLIAEAIEARLHQGASNRHCDEAIHISFASL
jgi:hypothetical protein